MYDETKTAVRKAFKVGQVLFSMGTSDFNRLVLATNNISSPSKSQIVEIMQGDSLPRGEAIASWFKRSYITAAVNAGFSKKQGLAMLTYAAMLKELE